MGVRRVTVERSSPHWTAESQTVASSFGVTRKQASLGSSKCGRLSAEWRGSIGDEIGGDGTEPTSRRRWSDEDRRPAPIYSQTARRDSLPLCDQQHLRHRRAEDAGRRSLLIDPAVRCVLGDSIAITAWLIARSRPTVPSRTSRLRHTESSSTRSRTGRIRRLRVAPTAHRRSQDGGQRRPTHTAHRRTGTGRQRHPSPARTR